MTTNADRTPTGRFRRGNQAAVGKRLPATATPDNAVTRLRVLAELAATPSPDRIPTLALLLDMANRHGAAIDVHATISELATHICTITIDANRLLAHELRIQHQRRERYRQTPPPPTPTACTRPNS